MVKFPGEMARWMSCGVIMASAHAAVAGSFFVSIPRTTKPFDDAAMAVEMVLLPTAPPAPAREIAPGPEMVKSPPPPPEPVPEVREIKFDPPPEIEDMTIEPEVVLEKIPEEQPEPEEKPAPELPPAPVTAAQVSMDFQPDEKLAAPKTGVLSSGTVDAELTWEANILAVLEQNRRYPEWAERRRQEDIVYVRFVMDRTGNVIFANIEQSHGYRLLDREARDLLFRTSPLPKPPEHIAGETVEVTVPIEFFIRQRGES